MSDPMTPLSHPTPPRKQHQYLLGLGVGLIPLLFFLLGIGLSFNTSISDLATFLLVGSAVLYLASIIAMIACLINQRVRFIGYGLLTTVLASPVIGFIGCTIIVFSHPSNL